MTKRDVISKTIASETLGLEDAASAVKEVQELRRRIKSRIRRGMKDAGRKALESQDHKGAWKYIRAATFTTPKGSDARFDLGEMNDHFARTVQSVDNEVIEDVASCDLEDSFAFQAVSTYRVAALLETVKTSTATGPDEIPGFLGKKARYCHGPSNLGNTKHKFRVKILSSNVEEGEHLPGVEGQGKQERREQLQTDINPPRAGPCLREDCSQSIV